jgi:hypothetical protein
MIDISHIHPEDAPEWVDIENGWFSEINGMRKRSKRHSEHCVRRIPCGLRVSNGMGDQGRWIRFFV